MNLSSKTESFSCWVLTEGMVGTENQCLGVTDALRITPDIIKIKLNQPWKSLTPWIGFEHSRTFEPRLNAPWPDLLITAGRKAIPAARFIKKKSGGKTFTVHLQDPKCSPKNFDLVAVPHHDPLRGKNVIVTDGACNRLTPEKLTQAKENFAPFGVMPAPNVAVLIGGNSRTHTLTEEKTRQLCQQLKNLNASLMITASRRTGETNTKILTHELAGNDIYFWDGTGENPYHGMLAHADYILVTSDSVSMISDACTTGKPVYIIELDGRSDRFDRFHNHIRTLGAARSFDEKLEDFSYIALQDAQNIADEIKIRMRIT